MKKEIRDKILKKFSKRQIEALEDFFNEKISKLNQIDTISSFEELLARKTTISVLKEMIMQLKTLHSQIEKSKNEYI